MKISHILVLLSLLLLISPVFGAAQLEWSKTIGFCVTAVDSNSAGTLMLAGLGNGSIFAYDNEGNLSWAYNTNSSAASRLIKKVAADSSGDIAWINSAGQCGYLSYNGVSAGQVLTGRNYTDVAISSDGAYYATTELSPARVTVRYQNGTTFAENSSFGVANWTKLGYSPDNSWLVTANQSDDTLYFWNISAWTGWEQFNPSHDSTKNVSQQFIDTFPYRQNISILGAATASKGIILANVSNVTEITKVNNSYYFYNPSTMGKYVYATLPGNLSNNQIGLLNLSRIEGNYYYLVFRPNFTNYNLYYGNTS
jgi:hypothetical protein